MEKEDKIRKLKKKYHRLRREGNLGAAKKIKRIIKKLEKDQ